MRINDSKAVLLATNNRAKQGKLSWLLRGAGIPVVTPQEIRLIQPSFDEDNDTHESNAAGKATIWSEIYDGVAIASDGGFNIPVLGNFWNSLHTRRFSEGSDVSRANGLTTLTASLEGEDRRAYWVEALAVAGRGTLHRTFTACSGVGYVAHRVREDLIANGFWVGSVWYFPEFGKYYPELSLQELERFGDHWINLHRQIVKALRDGFDITLGQR